MAVPPLTPYATVGDELARLDALLVALAGDVEAGRPLSRAALHGLSESIASVAHRIENEPGDLTADDAVTYLYQAAQGRLVLASAQAAPEDDPALAAARRIAQDGVVTASRYLQHR